MGTIGSNVAMACLNVESCDLSPRGLHVDAMMADANHQLEAPRGESRIVGGHVHTMCWDPSGQRLAVMFCGKFQLFFTDTV